MEDHGETRRVSYGGDDGLCVDDRLQLGPLSSNLLGRSMVPGSRSETFGRAGIALGIAWPGPLGE